MRRKIISLAFTAAIAALSACGPGRQSDETRPVRPVKYATVRLADGGDTQTYTATARSSIEASLSFRTNGLIESILVKPGDSVEEGQEIASLDNREASLSYEKSRASLENARIQEQNAQANLSRVRQLYQANNVSLAEYEQAKNQSASARANHESAKRSLDLQQRQLSYTRLVAPVSGVVSAVNHDANEFVKAGASVVQLNAGKHTELVVGVPEATIGRMQVGAPTSVRFSALVNREFEARITEVSFALDVNRSTYPVTVQMLEQSDRVKPGMAAEVTFRFTSEDSGNLVVPVNAIGEDSDGTFVYVIQDAGEDVGTIVKRSVQVGKLVEAGFVVLDGLADGERVATAGLSSLLDGMVVRLLQK